MLLVLVSNLIKKPASCISGFEVFQAAVLYSHLVGVIICIALRYSKTFCRSESKLSYIRKRWYQKHARSCCIRGSLHQIHCEILLQKIVIRCGVVESIKGISHLQISSLNSNIYESHPCFRNRLRETAWKGMDRKATTLSAILCLFWSFQFRFSLF